MRICGWGVDMDVLSAELTAVRDESFHLAFTLPTASGLAKLRKVHRERSQKEAATIRRSIKSAGELLETLVREDIDLTTYPQTSELAFLQSCRVKIS